MQTSAHIEFQKMKTQETLRAEIARHITAHERATHLLSRFARPTAEDREEEDEDDRVTG